MGGYDVLGGYPTARLPEVWLRTAARHAAQVVPIPIPVHHKQRLLLLVKLNKITVIGAPVISYQKYREFKQAGKKYL